MKTWKAQNEALRRELLSVTIPTTISQNIASSSTTSLFPAALKASDVACSELSGIFTTTTPEAWDKLKSEQKQAALESENRKLMEIVQQVTGELRSGDE